MKDEASRVFNDNGSFPSDVLNRLDAILFPCPNRSLPTTEIRSIWSERFATEGWVPNFLLPRSRQTISFFKNGFGVCVQLGNTCRVNSDMLKLETLYRLSIIDSAALVVPSNEYSKYLGSNHASVSVTERDLSTFDVAVTVPIAVIGVNPPTE